MCLRLCRCPPQAIERWLSSTPSSRSCCLRWLLWQSGGTLEDVQSQELRFPFETPHLAFVLLRFVLLLRPSYIGPTVTEEVVHESRQLVCRCGNRFARPHTALHASVVGAQTRLVAVQRT